jgi:hypothetical protein
MHNVMERLLACSISERNLEKMQSEERAEKLPGHQAIVAYQNGSGPGVI